MNVMEQFRLDGKTALVTGARRGIGKAMAIGLAEAGADIIAVSANLEATGSEIEQEVLALGRSFSGYRCDFSNRTELYRFIAQVKADQPAIDILVNNAGTVLREAAERHPDDYWDKIIDTNLSAQFVFSAAKSARGCWRAAAARSSSSRRCLRFREASPCPATRRARAGSGN